MNKEEYLKLLDSKFDSMWCHIYDITMVFEELNGYQGSEDSISILESFQLEIKKVRSVVMSDIKNTDRKVVGLVLKEVDDFCKK